MINLGIPAAGTLAAQVGDAEWREAFAAMVDPLPRLARAVKAATGADGVRLMQFNEAPAGQSVFHLHFHLIPVYEGVAMRGHGGGEKADDGELRALAAAMAAELK